jgi:hypothetical protein
MATLLPRESGSLSVMPFATENSSAMGCENLSEMHRTRMTEMQTWKQTAKRLTTACSTKWMTGRESQTQTQTKSVTGFESASETHQKKMTVKRMVWRTATGIS